MSLTDKIYRELMDGLGKDLDWQQFIAKYSNSKGPLYNAIGRFFTEVGLKIRALNEEGNRVQSELDQAGLRLDSLNRKIKEGESNIASLEEEENILNEGIKTLEAELAEKSGLSKNLADLEGLGFNIERLSLLSDALREIGAKHGFKSKEAVSKFFGDLKDYDLVLEAEAQLKRLQTQIETKKLETENWELRLTNAQGQVEILKKEKAKIEGAIDVIKEAGIKQLKAMTEHTTKQLTTLANREMNEMRGVGQEVRNEFNDFFNQLDASVKKVFEVGQEFERRMRELQKYEDVKDVLEPHAASSEEEE